MFLELYIDGFILFLLLLAIFILFDSLYFIIFLIIWIYG